MAIFSSIRPTSVMSGIGATVGRVGMLLVPVIILLDLLTPAEAQKEPPKSSGNCTREAEPCKDGLFLPMWTPQGNLSAGDKAARATVYLLAMVYMFLGVSIVADRFMAAIEVITSKEKEVIIKKANGQTTVVNVRIWNETVSNLTLMALGSSAPEILLAAIEIVHNKFTAGELGPSTIVGSAAFNLFIIIALCVTCIPDGEIRRIKHLRVFIITATWSVFAYVWLYFILSVSSKGVVEVWEAVLTFLFFPGTVVTAYIADKKIMVHKLLSRKYRASRKGIVVQSEGLNDTELVDGKSNHLTEEPIFKGMDSDDINVREFEQHRKDFIEILRELRQKHPNIDMHTLEEMAEMEAVNRGPKSRAFYRIQATRKLTGGGKVIKKAKIERRASLQDVKVEEKEDDGTTHVFFDPGHYTVMENVGTFNLTVTREGGDLEKTLYVDFHTEDGSANAGSDYVASEGTLVFQPGETHKQFSVTVIDDDLFEEDEHFYAHLSNLRVGDADGMFESAPGDFKAQLATPFMATVMILDDDHPGIFHFEDKELTVTENVGELLIKVQRSSGARGCVAVPFHAVDGTAKAGKDYEILSGELYFENDETEVCMDSDDINSREFEQHRKDFIEILRELRQKHPNIDIHILEEMAEMEAVNRGPKSRALYRIQATRKLTGGGKVINKAEFERRASLQDVKVEEKEDDGTTHVFFDPGHYTVMENVGTFNLTVTREGGDLEKTLYVDFHTEDGSANAGSDYVASEGTLVFQPGETHKQFSVTVIDDDLFEEDEHFYAHLSNLRVGDADGMFESAPGDFKAQLAIPFMATVMILDDDHPGIFNFKDKELTVTENVGELLIKVQRSSGARGCVAVPFHAVDGTAKAGKDYEILSGELYFENDETE